MHEGPGLEGPKVSSSAEARGGGGVREGHTRGWTLAQDSRLLGCLFSPALSRGFKITSRGKDHMTI